MCSDCDLAAKRPWHGFFAGCPGCKARSVARSPQFFAVRKAGQQNRHYRALLEQMGVEHEAVKTAAAADVHLTPRKEAA